LPNAGSFFLLTSTKGDDVVNPQLFLIETLKNAKQRNPMFSLRAFAKQLMVSPAHLSQLLSGKRPMTLRVALKVAEKFDLTPLERAQLLQLAGNRRSGKQRREAQDFRYLESKEFHLISDWYYFAILSLGELKDNEASAAWIAKRLGLTFLQAREAYERLKDLGFLVEENGKFKQSGTPLHSTRDVASTALRKFHKQHLELAQDRLETVSVEMREYSTMTMAVSRKKMKTAKKMIHEFKTKLCQYLESEAVDDVYTLAIQLFPLTNINQQEGSRVGPSKLKTRGEL
jgi:uncharacterized protein (TIGR02147 family)